MGCLPGTPGTIAGTARTGLELQRQALDATEFVVCDGCCPAANIVHVLGRDNDVELTEIIADESGFGADLTTDSQEARSALHSVRCERK
jgi:hypothetical protein